MNKPHKHAELIKAWADGAEIQYFDYEEGWTTQEQPAWYVDTEYRVKPEPKPDIALYYFFDGSSKLIGCNIYGSNLRLVIDGKTRELKSAEVLK